MPTVSKSALVPHSAERIFDLVNAVDQYPVFLPWCGGSTIYEQSESLMIAEIVIGYKSVNKGFKTTNVLKRPDHDNQGTIKVKLLQGPFDSLNGEWTFTPLNDDGSRIDFELNYEFSGVFMARLIGPVFNKIAETFVDSFVSRADELYGH
jgi:ribosome-associated toxin RatA of RatAB toxin-antitoxin module